MAFTRTRFTAQDEVEQKVPLDPESTVSAPSLRELLHQRPALIENYKKQRFFCKAAVDNLLTRETISTWIKTHPLHRESSTEAHKEVTIDGIINNARLLFAILVATELESFTSTLLAKGQSDKSLPSIDYECLNMSSEERQRLMESCKKFSPILRRNTHVTFSLETVLPFTQREPTDKRGTFGLIYRVEVADGHLEGYNQNIVAEKLVRPENREDESICRREVDTLREREHPNIEPLLASYAMKTTASDSIAPLHLIFPFADDDLKEWMNHPQPPIWLDRFSRSEERAYLYRCIYALVSGLSFLHREKGETTTAHHDLKPENILVFGEELKLADFGRSHLHTLAQGSETHVNSGLGTYEYQPPKYWRDDGRHAEVKHGRAFDI